MPQPSLKQMAQSRELKLGHFIVEFATPGIGQILKGAGCDFALFDTEHSGFGFETIKAVLRYMQAADLPTIVRVPSREYHHIARAADMGAEGIMLPMVGSAAEARQIVECMKYFPEGRRGVALAIAHDRYLPGPTLDKLAEANRRTTLFAQIETRDGVKNAEKIAAVDGVDCLWVGHFDLSASLGIPGQFDHKDFTDAIATVAKACHKHKKALGRLVPTVDEAIRYHREGFDFVCYSGDVWALQGAVGAALAEIRARVGDTRSKAEAEVKPKPGNKSKTEAKSKAEAKSKTKLKAEVKPKGRRKTA